MELEARIEPGGSSSPLSRITGLDGLRALAVLAVMAFHNGFAWIPGGYYGVDAFFVLSGYLITSLLVTEWRTSGTIRFGRFWARRARRLLPALFVLVAVVGFVHLEWPGLLPWPDPLPDAVATTFYVANWHFIVSSQGYFQSPTSPLLHTWSLAIEEQFYLVWPLAVFCVMGGLTRLGRRRTALPDRRRRLVVLGVLCGAGTVASAAWMWVLTPADPNRAYYGTDTRAQALLLGAALAAALAARSAPSARTRRVAGVAGLAGLAGMLVVWHQVPETSTLAFHGGFLLASLAAGVVVASVVLSPQAPLARALSLRPVRYVGAISYGAYLWHWPIILVMTAQRTGLGPWPLFACRSALTLAIAAVSSHFLELPIRRGALRPRLALAAAPVAAGVAIALVAASATTVAIATPVRVRPPVHPSGPPVTVLLVGDSMAGSLGATLAPEAPGYDVKLVNEGQPGCAVSTDSMFRFLLFTSAPGPPCQLGDPDALLQKWRQWVDTYRPDVVVYLARTDLFNQDFEGTWTSIGDPAFDRFYEAQLRRGVAILGSRGARVVLLTSPYYDSTLSGGLSPVPEDAPGRVTLDDRILEQVASSTPGVSLFPLGTVTDPEGRYQQDVDGVNMRCTDGVHFSVWAGQVIAPRLLPQLAAEGRAAHVATLPHTPPPPAVVPPWYDKLQCG